MGCFRRVLEFLVFTDPCLYSRNKRTFQWNLAKYVKLILMLSWVVAFIRSTIILSKEPAPRYCTAYENIGQGHEPLSSWNSSRVCSVEEVEEALVCVDELHQQVLVLLARLEAASARDEGGRQLHERPLACGRLAREFGGDLDGAPEALAHDLAFLGLDVENVVKHALGSGFGNGGLATNVCKDALINRWLHGGGLVGPVRRDARHAGKSCCKFERFLPNAIFLKREREERFLAEVSD